VSPEREVIISAGRGVQHSFRERVQLTLPLVWTWTRRDLRTRYRQSVLRSAWSFLQPITILVTYGWVLTHVLDTRSPDAPYLTFAWSGIVPFTFFATSLGQGVGSIQQAGGIISRVYFPREVIPLAVVGGALVDLGIMLITMVAVSWVQVGHPGVHLLGLVAVWGVLAEWTIALTVAMAALTVFRRDLNFATPLALRILFIVTPVMYSAALIADSAEWLVRFNPLAVVIEGTRDCLYRGVWPDAGLLGGQAAAGAVALVAAFALFRRLDPRMSDYV
jgi:ABC-type polysaccharide/polyol phosphate export permease